MSIYRLTRPPADTPPLYAQDGKGYDACVYAHYFIGGCDWLVTEYDPEGDYAFGWACLNLDRDNAELGYFSLVELDSTRAPIRLNGVLVRDAIPVEYEEDWELMTLREAIALLDKRQGRSGSEAGRS